MKEPTINTGGGATVGENVTAGLDFVGRDKVGAQVFVDNLEKFARWLGIAAVLAVALWSTAYFLTTLRIQAETRQIEARKPFLEKQLALYTEATQAAAVLATTTDEAELTAARNRFWALYWGELAMVENGGVSAEAGGVESAMVAYGRCLKQECEQTELQRLALNLAHACRDSLAVSWGVTDWQAPVYTP